MTRLNVTSVTRSLTLNLLWTDICTRMKLPQKSADVESFLDLKVNWNCIS